MSNFFDNLFNAVLARGQKAIQESEKSKSPISFERVVKKIERCEMEARNNARSSTNNPQEKIRKKLLPVLFRQVRKDFRKEADKNRTDAEYKDFIFEYIQGLMDENVRLRMSGKINHDEDHIIKHETSKTIIRKLMKIYSDVML